MKEYEVKFTLPDGSEHSLSTDNRTVARNAKILLLENEVSVTVTRTAKKEVSFAGVDVKPETPAKK